MRETKDIVKVMFKEKGRRDSEIGSKKEKALVVAGWRAHNRVVSVIR